MKTSQFLEIIQTIAHRMKNPIATIMWTAEKIKQSITKEGSNINKKIDYSKLADFLIDDAKTLSRQTNNILKLAQIQNQKLQRKSLKQLLEKLVNHYGSVVEEKVEINLKMTEDITLNIDENLFKEAIINLIDNALDAMPDGGKLSIAAVPIVSPVKRRINQVLIEVEDTGCGIDEADIPQLFTPFFTKKENIKGIGIGLNICKRIIEAHGGTIDVHSRKGFGTKFAIKIPLH